MILLFPPPECWDYKCVPPQLPFNYYFLYFILRISFWVTKFRYSPMFSPICFNWFIFIFLSLNPSGIVYEIRIFRILNFLPFQYYRLSKLFFFLLQVLSPLLSSYVSWDVSGPHSSSYLQVCASVQLLLIPWDVYFIPNRIQTLAGFLDLCFFLFLLYINPFQLWISVASSLLLVSQSGM
jgi:hypothetical protein